MELRFFLGLWVYSLRFDGASDDFVRTVWVTVTVHKVQTAFSSRRLYFLVSRAGSIFWFHACRKNRNLEDPPEQEQKESTVSGLGLKVPRP